MTFMSCNIRKRYLWWNWNTVHAPNKVRLEIGAAEGGVTLLNMCNLTIPIPNTLYSSSAVHCVHEQYRRGQHMFCERVWHNLSCPPHSEWISLGAQTVAIVLSDHLRSTSTTADDTELPPEFSAVHMYTPLSRTSALIILSTGPPDCNTACKGWYLLWELTLHCLHDVQYYNTNLWSGVFRLAVQALGQE
jgi:hypothetical protein